MSPEEAQKRAGGGFFLLKALISLSLLSLLLWRTDLEGFLKTLRSTKISLFLACLLLYMLAQVLSSYRWQRLLEAEEIHIPLPHLVLLYFEGMFFNLFLPTLVGGDVVRGYSLYKYSRRGGESFASILVERLSGLAALMAIALLALALGYPYLQEPLVAYLILAVAVGLALGILGLANRRLKEILLSTLGKAGLHRFQEKAGWLYESIQRYRGHRRALGQALILSFILQTSGIFIFYLISKALRLSIPLPYFFLFVPLIHVISMIPISLSGLGVREGITVFLFAKAGVGSASALGLSLTWFLMVVLASLPGGVIFLTEKPRPM